jgi:hypothetical protein
MKNLYNKPFTNIQFKTQTISNEKLTNLLWSSGSTYTRRKNNQRPGEHAVIKNDNGGMPLTIL